MKSVLERLAFLAVATLLAACGSSPAAATDSPVRASDIVSTSPASSSVRIQPPASSPAVPSPPPGSNHPAHTDPFVGSVVTTLADDGLRARSKPGVSDDSYPAEPLLPLGTDVYVLAGPVSASGYPWYEIVPLSSRDLPSGWVASAGRDGEPWVAAGDFDCPQLPTTFSSLARLPGGVGLVCFPGVPITVEARVIPCNCDVDGGWYEPSWFSYGSGSPELLVEPGSTTPPDSEDWFVLRLDPAGEHPDNTPVGEVVQITGVFDHPAAAGCTYTGMDEEPIPSQDCRLMFAVTQLLVRGP